ncbi:unnamed protein product [Vitrella brassicaformis CCMP3155]|uniref:Cyclin-dependent kinases regulatory subunit n=1 Tax=Vitrella brassicaformis (strain CCMP3155) TaxID=1169540 RepID=A0A0G4FIT6_VITBC|nr:unnamed protein product [Vitrella brassicaformis CCMP3155]|mmetsp:Transcript_39383/g.98530  ORF Transcript_39383/g.98530 Transcript_39383/m.98530 type:complete len:95 (-) Transcript_39383:317-601(-)|eukprot:CEM13207.1 unnamed protein product [Vitrella brassicaformis CCMP3155]
MPHYPDTIEYSDKYQDDVYEYRHVILPHAVARKVNEIRRRKQDQLLTEAEWREVGVVQSRGWVNYHIHEPEPHILLFRRKLGTNPKTGQVEGNN